METKIKQREETNLMGFLQDRAVEYNAKLVRANAVSEGDVIDFDDDFGLVTKVEKFGFDLAEDDDATRALLEEVKSYGEDDKVSPHFDETVAVTVALAVFDDEGKVHLTPERRYFPEWGLVTVYV